MCLYIFTPMCHVSGCHVHRVYICKCKKKFTPVPPPHIAQSGPVSPNQGPARRPMRGRLEEHLYHLNIREEAGGIVWVKPSSKCASCYSNETDQRNIHTHVNVSLKAYVDDETIYNSCARARFAGCTYLRHIILALSTVCIGYKIFLGHRGMLLLIKNDSTT